MLLSVFMFFLFFFNDTATTEIYTLSLHDALPICTGKSTSMASRSVTCRRCAVRFRSEEQRLNSSHVRISYAVFCLKKKKYSDSKKIQQKQKKKSFKEHGQLDRF